MPLETLPYDSSEYLGSREAQLELIDDAVETGDVDYIAHALGVIARARGMTQIAREAGLPREALYKALIENDDSKHEILVRVMKALGARLQAGPICDDVVVERENA